MVVVIRSLVFVFLSPQIASFDLVRTARLGVEIRSLRPPPFTFLTAPGHSAISAGINHSKLSGCPDPSPLMNFDTQA